MGVMMDWKRVLAYISGSVDQELLLRNEYLVTENQILRDQLKGRLRLTDGERKTLAETGKRLGKKALEEVASIVKPETILAWHRRLVAKKFRAVCHSLWDFCARNYQSRAVDRGIPFLIASRMFPVSRTRLLSRWS